MKLFITLIPFFAVLRLSAWQQRHAVLSLPSKTEVVQRKVDTIPQPAYSNVVILGNSITFTPANPSLGWYGNWGMAATVADSDYVHLLTVKFKQRNPNCVVTIRNISSFETDFKNYSLDANLKDLRDIKPDLLIIRIGENVNQAPLDTAAFRDKYQALINYFSNKPPILAVGSFWSMPVVDKIMSGYSKFITLSNLSRDPTNASFGLWTNTGVQYHPGNKGMRNISNAIWSAILKL